MSTETAHSAIHVAVAFSDHMPVMAILVPFLAAPLTVVLGSRALAWPITFVSSLVSLVIASWLMMQTIDGTVISYKLGGWAPPVGIEYRVDAFNAFIMLLVSGISTVVLPFARTSVNAEIPRRNHTLFYTCYLLCFTCLMGVVVTGDAFNVFVFLEISSLSTYVLIAQGAYRDKRALTASFDYLMMGTIGATFFVIGIGLLYMATCTLNMADIADRIAEQGANRTVRSAFAFIVVGMGLKVAVFPLHLWLPNAYTQAPSAVTAFLAATSTKVALYVMMRFMFSVFQPQFTFEVNTLEILIFPLAILAMFGASLMAVFQQDMKRMLAYSSIAQIGYMLLGIGLLTEGSLTAAITHMFNHGITKATLFLGVGALVYRTGGSFHGQIAGMGRRMPWTSAAIVFAGFSLIGVPGTAGFISKWILVQSAIEKGLWPLGIVIAMSSLLAVIYIWRVVEALYLAPPREDLTEVREAPLSMLIPLGIMALACLYFGTETSLSVGAAKTAAAQLLAGPIAMAH